RMREGEVGPLMATVRVPALVRGDELITETGRIRHVIRAAKEIEGLPGQSGAGYLGEAEGGGLSAAMFWGNPFTDVPDLRSNSLVTVDGDPESATREALNLANLFWQHHQKMQVPLTGVAEAVEIARQTRAGTVVLVDAADATSSGAPGDSNVILSALLEHDYRGSALLPIVDAPAVKAAFAAGVGAPVRTMLGGSLDPARFLPLPVEARVRLLSDGIFRSETTREQWYAGPTAVLQIGEIVLVVTSRAVSLYDRS